jgi:hypothetical protein
MANLDCWGAGKKQSPVGRTYFKHRDAEHAAKMLRENRVAVEIVEVSLLMCPGALQKRGWALFVSTDHVRKASRLLEIANGGKAPKE